MARSMRPSRRWDRVRAISLSHAMELCLEHAREVHRRSVDRVADQMGLGNRWVLYKWMESGRIPANLIRPFEAACGIDLVTRYVAYSAHKLAVDMPTGRKASGKEIHELQASFADAVGLLLRFYDGQAGRHETLAAVWRLMEDAAWHSVNIQKSDAPELDFSGAVDGEGRLQGRLS
jgi:hypothetical protein